MDLQKMEAAFRTSNLIANYLFNTLTPEEKAELDKWIENNKLLFEELTNTAKELNDLSRYHATPVRRKLLRRTKRFNNCKLLRSAQLYSLHYTCASNSSCA